MGGNHAAMMAIGFAPYNHCWPDQTLTQEAKAKTTPAIAAGLEDRPWPIRELVEKSTLS